MVGLVHLSGWLGALALLLALASSLLGRWSGARRKVLFAWRRRLGLVGFVLAGLHASVALGGWLAPRSSDEAVNLFAALPYLRHGALAVVMLAPLAATSFPALNARLGLRTWSTLHRFVYAAVLLVALHVVAGPSADPRVASSYAVAVGVLLVLRLVPRRAAPAASTGTDEASSLTTESPDNP